MPTPAPIPPPLPPRTNRREPVSAQTLAGQSANDGKRFPLWVLFAGLAGLLFFLLLLAVVALSVLLLDANRDQPSDHTEFQPPSESSSSPAEEAPDEPREEPEAEKQRPKEERPEENKKEGAEEESGKDDNSGDGQGREDRSKKQSGDKQGDGKSSGDDGERSGEEGSQDGKSHGDRGAGSDSQSLPGDETAGDRQGAAGGNRRDHRGGDGSKDDEERGDELSRRRGGRPPNGVVPGNGGRSGDGGRSENDGRDGSDERSDTRRGDGKPDGGDISSGRDRDSDGGVRVERPLPQEKPRQPASKFFGITAPGNTFVYLIEGSVEVRGAGFARIADEVLASLGKLSADQKALVVLYSDDCYPMFFPSIRLEPVACTDAMRTQVRSWFDTFEAWGPSHPGAALKFALSVKCDAVVFLTSKSLAENEVSEIKRANVDRIPIHILSFGNRTGEKTLNRIAADSGGSWSFAE